MPSRNPNQLDLYDMAAMQAVELVAERNDFTALDSVELEQVYDYRVNYLVQTVKYFQTFKTLSPYERNSRNAIKKLYTGTVQLFRS